MLHKFFGKIAAGAIVSLAVLAWSSQAEAGWRWHGSSGGGSSGGWGGGSSGGWGGSSGGWGGGSSGGGSSGGWGGSSGGGSSGGWGGHFAHKHWRHKGWGGSSGGGWGGSSGGGSSGGWGGSSGGSSGGGSSGGGSSGGTYYYAPGVEVDPSTTVPMTPAGEVPPAAPVPGGIAPAPGQSTSTSRVDGLLAVNVPADAKIYVNGQATTSTGNARQYVSRDLQPGFNYSYEVRAEVVRDGQTIEQMKKIDIRAGETANLAFDFPASSAAETSLTVHVPADAKVFLAGNSTKSNGETRVFRTTGLTGSKAWEGYTIRVELERGGRTLTKEETITLKAGQSQELNFDFEGDKVASAR